MDTGMWPESYNIMGQHQDTKHILADNLLLIVNTQTDWPVGLFIIYLLHSHRHAWLDTDLIIIFAANHGGGGQMVKSISWLLPGTIGQWEDWTCADWPMRGLRTCCMCWHVTWTQAEWWKFFGPGHDVFNMSSDSFHASDWLNCTLKASDWPLRETSVFKLVDINITSIMKP